jgi:hypothetical protein
MGADTQMVTATGKVMKTNAVIEFEITDFYP